MWGGHMSAVLKNYGILKKASDLIDRGYGQQQNFLEFDGEWHGDIVTNPPYKYANDFIIKSMKIMDSGSKLALFLPIRYLEGKARRKTFDEYPPIKIYVSSSRLKCAMNGKFEEMTGSATSYAWFIWQKGYKGPTELSWFN